MLVYLENVGGEPRASYNEGYPTHNGMRNGSRSLRDREKTNLDQESNMVFPQISPSLREHVDPKKHHSQHLRTYNSLLKYGR